MILIVVHTFDLFFDGFGWVQPMTDVVVVGVLEAEVILLDDVHLVVHLLHQLLPRRFLLQRKDDELGIVSRPAALTTTIVGEMNIQAAFQRMRGYG